MQNILNAFPGLPQEKIDKLQQLGELYKEWNEKINVISRKDIDNVYDRHILHSLAICKVINFKPDTNILDVGTGGGIPGIPLAIMFPEAKFHLVDRIAKKISVVNGIVESLGLMNVLAEQKSVEEIRHLRYDFVVGRGVTDLSVFANWVQKNISKRQTNALPNGIIYLKGGDLTTDKEYFGRLLTTYNIKDYFEDEFYQEKYVVYVDLS